MKKKPNKDFTAKQKAIFEQHVAKHLDCLKQSFEKRLSKVINKAVFVSEELEGVGYMLRGGEVNAVYPNARHNLFVGLHRGCLPFGFEIPIGQIAARYSLGNTGFWEGWQAIDAAMPVDFSEYIPDVLAEVLHRYEGFLKAYGEQPAQKERVTKEKTPRHMAYAFYLHFLGRDYNGKAEVKKWAVTQDIKPGPFYNAWLQVGKRLSDKRYKEDLRTAIELLKRDGIDTGKAKAALDTMEKMPDKRKS